ncbi:MAG: hypothetical protein C4325_01310 [Blastocatellia bacterium]
MSDFSRELAFKQDLFLGEIWSDRFFSLIQKKLDIKNAETVLHFNAGTGRNCFALAEHSRNTLQITGICETPQHFQIAQDKAAALKSPIRFQAEPVTDRTFDIVIADASLSRPEHLPTLLSQVALRKFSHFFGKSPQKTVVVIPV